jgi:hypothetical protein
MARRTHQRHFHPGDDLAVKLVQTRNDGDMSFKGISIYFSASRIFPLACPAGFDSSSPIRCGPGLQRPLS